jgi:hypothetical protein
MRKDEILGSAALSLALTIFAIITILAGTLLGEVISCWVVP